MKSIPRIILASNSPRRVDLMKQVGLDFQTIAPTADETPFRQEKPGALVKRLAFEKAMSVVPFFSDSVVIIGADTIVVSPEDKKILGKPRGQANAKKMLRTLSGKTHSVLTGFCLLSCDLGIVKKKKIQMSQSKVKMRKLTSIEIDRYVLTGEPMDKAGSYAAQGIGSALIESLQGSYTNVVGLPISQLILGLEEMIGIEFLQWINYAGKN